MIEDFVKISREEGGAHELSVRDLKKNAWHARRYFHAKYFFLGKVTFVFDFLKLYFKKNILHQKPLIRWKSLIFLYNSLNSLINIVFSFFIFLRKYKLKEWFWQNYFYLVRS